MPRYIFKLVWTFDAFDDAEARRHFVENFLKEKMEDLPPLYRRALNKAGSDENILRRGEEK